MGRPIILLALALFALPAGVSAQIGSGPQGGKSGSGAQCQKGTSQANQTLQKSLGTPYANAGYPSIPVSTSAQSLNPTTVKAIHDAFVMLKTVVGNLQSRKIDTPPAKALAVSFKTAVRIGDSSSLTDVQKEARVLRIMDQVVTDLKTLASDNSLSLAHRTALAEVVTLFQEMNQTAQRGSNLAARTNDMARLSR